MASASRRCEWWPGARSRQSPWLRSKRRGRRRAVPGRAPCLAEERKCPHQSSVFARCMVSARCAFDCATGICPSAVQHLLCSRVVASAAEQSAVRQEDIGDVGESPPSVRSRVLTAATSRRRASKGSPSAPTTRPSSAWTPATVQAPSSSSATMCRHAPAAHVPWITRALGTLLVSLRRNGKGVEVFLNRCAGRAVLIRAREEVRHHLARSCDLA